MAVAIDGSSAGRAGPSAGEAPPTIDVYFSYQRQDVVAAWIGYSFLPVLMGHLSVELGRPAHAFFDVGMERFTSERPVREPSIAPNWSVESIPGGATWSRTIADALARSRCLVAVLTKSYFGSPWCNHEWETVAGNPPDGGARDVILPILWKRRTDYPERATRLQTLDFERFALATPRLRDGNRGEQFEEATKFAAQRLALMVEQEAAFVHRPAISVDPSLRDRDDPSGSWLNGLGPQSQSSAA